MSPYRRNLLVGVTVLTGLAMMGWMMLRFGSNLGSVFAPQYVNVRFIAERADGLAEGSPVFYRGVPVGRILRVSRTKDDVYVIIEAQVEQSPPLPANVHGVIRSQGLLGGASSLSLELTDTAPQGQLTAGTQVEARFVGLDILPPEFAELARELRETSRQFRESNLIVHLDEEVQKIGKVVESIQTIVDDPKMREDIKMSLANVRETTERANRIAERMETLTGEASQTLEQTRGAISKTEGEILGIARNLNDRLTQMGKLIEQFNSITARVEQGEGTAGQILNDPRLYESMVDTAREMQATVSDLRRLVQQWEQEGISLKMR